MLVFQKAQFRINYAVNKRRYIKWSNNWKVWTCLMLWISVCGHTLLPGRMIYIKQEEKFKYLGSFLPTNRKFDYEIKRKIALSKLAFKKKRSILICSNIAMSTRLRVLKCNIWSIRLYECYEWMNTISI